MTQLLERAFKEASELPEHEQDAFASVLLEELDSHRRWEEAQARRAASRATRFQSLLNLVSRFSKLLLPVHKQRAA